MGIVGVGARSAVLTVGVVWGAALVLFGLRVLQIRSAPGPVSARWEFWGAVAAIGAGQYVFIVMVANRLVPAARGRLADVLEVGVAAVVVVAVALWAMLYFAGETA